MLCDDTRGKTLDISQEVSGPLGTACMGLKSTGRTIEDYRKRYQNPRSAAEYHSSLKSPRTMRELLDLRRSVGWVIALAE